MHYVFFRKNVLSAHHVPTTCAHTALVRRVPERVACPSWGAPPWVLQVVGLREVKEGVRIVTIKVVLFFDGHIACRTGCILCGPKHSVPPFAIFRRLPVDFNGHVRQSPSVVAFDSEDGIVGV